MLFQTYFALKRFSSNTSLLKSSVKRKIYIWPKGYLSVINMIGDSSNKKYIKCIEEIDIINNVKEVLSGCKLKEGVNKNFGTLEMQLNIDNMPEFGNALNNGTSYKVKIIQIIPQTREKYSEFDVDAKLHDNGVLCTEPIGMIDGYESIPIKLLVYKEQEAKAQRKLKK